MHIHGIGGFAHGDFAIHNTDSALAPATPEDQAAGTPAAKVTRGSAPRTAPPQAAPEPPHAVTDLGQLDKPGKALRNKLETLKPGETIRFTTGENQIHGLGEIKITPPGAINVTSRVVHPMQRGVLGSATMREYSFTVPNSAKAGAVATIATSGQYQTRNDHDWAFHFKIKVGK